MTLEHIIHDIITSPVEKRIEEEESYNQYLLSLLTASSFYQHIIAQLRQERKQDAHLLDYASYLDIMCKILIHCPDSGVSTF